MLTAITRNLGHRVTAMEWLAHEAEAGTLPDVLFLQEVLPTRLGHLELSYDLHFTPASPGLPSARTSMLGFRRSLGLAVTDNLDVFAPLGTYAVCANVELANRSVIFASVHTSPSHAEEANLIGTSATPRRCELAPWWADVLIAKTSSHEGAPLLIAGDLNEARAWDASHPGHTCSADFFDAIKEAGLTDVTFRDWRNEERPTRRHPDYQLDRVFASDVIADQIKVADVELIHDGLSDHAAINFQITG
jgi:endonuclease/exonuclease/phosphatase family metal-dependent hydrolase